MHFFAKLRFNALVIVFILPFLRAYDYKEISRWNASCFPKDTCSVPRDLDDSDVHNCDCSSLCVLYDSCCIDSPFLNISSKYEITASCRSGEKNGKSVFMIDICPTDYKGSAAIRRRCEQPAKNWSDPFNNVPVTNIKSLKTYKSLFCAICHDENVKELEMWQVMLDCSTLGENMGICTSDKEFVINNMMFIREKGLWGIWSWDSKTDWKFRYISVSFQIPLRLKTLVKECRPNLISGCPQPWRDVKTRRLCETYMGAVYFKDTAFRNIHCAICNGKTNFTNMTCHDHTVYKSTQMSFGILMDFDLTHGDKVGNVEKKCDTDQVYDPFSKKCRNIECPLPGYTLKDHKCVKE